MTFGSRLDSHRSATNNNARCHCSPLPHALMAAEYTMVLARKGTTSLNTSSASLHCVACPSSLMLSTMGGRGELQLPVTGHPRTRLCKHKVGDYPHYWAILPATSAKSYARAQGMRTMGNAG
ncbi:unnamed protein product [Prorocentrum cordatum]|uniref:Uncharacterized protein n=1 Tax=Prorocentrum cordatum TaxID=2364126 RepID=A0ABN9YF48_9DINO|nr:unnamed protein product [Polarella glacialis]